MISSVAIALTAMFSFGSFRNGEFRILDYADQNIHKAVSRAILNGQLHLNDRIELGIPHDFEFHDGAVFTHWGLGVPLLELPFHALFGRWASAQEGLFYDRTIFLFYFLITSLFFMCSLQKTLTTIEGTPEEESWLHTLVLSLFFLTYTLFWLTSLYFRTYEATVCYFILAQIAAAACYLRWHRTRQSKWVLWLGVLASLGLLIRPTGLHYAIVWLLLICAQPSSRRALAQFVLAGLPLLLLWLYFNWVRTGNPFSSGFENVLSRLDEFYSLKFENPCFQKGMQSYIDLAQVIFKILFFKFTPTPDYYPQNLPPSILNCGLMIEDAGGFLLGPLSLVVFVFALAWGIKKKNGRLLAPVAGILLLFASYVYGTGGFGNRYAGDFAVLFGLLLLELTIFTPFWKSRWFRLTIIFIAAAWATSIFFQRIVPQLPTIQSQPSLSEQTLLPAAYYVREELGYFQPHARGEAWLRKTALELRPAQAPFLPNSRGCPPLSSYPQLEMDFWGLHPDCSSWAIMHFYLGVPIKSEPHYTLEVVAESRLPLHPIAIALNGKTYSCRFIGEKCETPIELDIEKFYSPHVAVTIKWADTFDEVAVKFKSATIR